MCTSHAEERDAAEKKTNAVLMMDPVRRWAVPLQIVHVRRGMANKLKVRCQANNRPRHSLAMHYCHTIQRLVSHLD